MFAGSYKNNYKIYINISFQFSIHEYEFVDTLRYIHGPQFRKFLIIKNWNLVKTVDNGHVIILARISFDN